MQHPNSFDRRLYPKSVLLFGLSCVVGSVIVTHHSHTKILLLLADLSAGDLPSAHDDTEWTIA